MTRSSTGRSILISCQLTAHSLILFELNGQKLEAGELETANEPLYKTAVVTNYGLQFLDRAAQSEAPFFLYLPYHAPHYPLQAPDEDIERYEGVFARGWDDLRRSRFVRQKDLGIIPPHASLPEPEDNIYPHRGPKRGGGMIHGSSITLRRIRPRQTIWPPSIPKR